MTTITLENAQQDLPALIKRVLAGEEIVIESSGKATVKLLPVTNADQQAALGSESYRGRGALKGELSVGPEFFDPLSDEECGTADEKATS